MFTEKEATVNGLFLTALVAGFRRSSFRKIVSNQCSPPLFWVKKGEITKGRIAGKASKASKASKAKSLSGFSINSVTRLVVSVDPTSLI